MIKKLERHIRVEKGLTQDIKISCPPEQSEIVSKINELVDAVNDITDWIKRTDETIVKYGIKPIENGKCAKNAQDPYAEQRKWVGCLCRFWFADAEHPTFGILDFVDADSHPEPFHINCGESEQGWYPHCEPVKPTDSIIYKGE